MTIQRENPTVYLPTGDPETENVASLQHPGDLGRRFPTGGGKWYRKIKMDSGVTAATPTGVAAAKQLGYWKDRDEHLVTNDIRFSESGRNSVAGIIRNAITGGRYGNILVEAPEAVAVHDATGTFAKGDLVIASATGPKITREAAGTSPTYQKIGVATGPEDGSENLTFRLSVPDIE